MDNQPQTLHRLEQIELLLHNIQIILIGIAALAAGAALFALCYIEQTQPDSANLGFWVGLATFMLVALALRPRKRKARRRPVVTESTLKPAEK